MNLRRLGIVILVAGCLVTCASAQDLTIAAAADLNFALKDLAAQFEKDTANKITLSFGSSGNLYSQIINGAPFDLFFSADEQYPQKLAAAGFMDSASLRTYAMGHLVLWVSSKLGLDPKRFEMELLLQPSVLRIAIANPQTAPYGRAAVAALEHYSIRDKVSAKLVVGENVSQAAQFVQSGNAQAGLIALSLASSPAMKGSGLFWELPSDSYPSLRQVAGIVSTSKHKAAAESFLNYMSSPKGAAVLQQYGFAIRFER